MANIDSIERKYYDAGTATQWAKPQGTYRLKAGYRDNQKNYVGVISFDLPIACSSLTLIFYNTDNVRTNSPNMRFKFTTSEDENLVAAIEADSKTGENTVAGDSTVTTSCKVGTSGSTTNYTGKFIVNTAKHGQTTVTFNKSLSAGTHYLYIWSNDFSKTYNYMDICWRDSSNTYKFTATYVVDENAGGGDTGGGDNSEESTGDDYSGEGFDAGSIYVRNYDNGNDPDGWVKLGSPRVVAGYTSSSNFVLIFRFDLSKSAKKITLSAVSDKANCAGSTNIDLKYKLVSGAEDGSLIGANANTAADGSISIKKPTGDFVRFSIEFDKHVPAGTTYLYLWTNKDSGTANSLGIRCYATGQYKTTITYEEGGSFVYIDNGTSFDAYEIYIDNGTDWDLYEAYIDNGSGWDLYG